MLRDLFSLFPAYAGVIPLKRGETVSTQPFPRIRGGDPRPLCFLAKSLDFSPHTRG